MLRQLRRDLRANNKSYREEREEKARKEIEEARRKAAEELAEYRGEVSATAQQKFDETNLEAYVPPPKPEDEGMNEGEMIDGECANAQQLDEHGNVIVTYCYPLLEGGPGSMLEPSVYEETNIDTLVTSNVTEQAAPPTQLSNTSSSTTTATSSSSSSSSRDNNLGM